MPDPKLGLVTTYAREGHGYRNEDDSEDTEPVHKDEEACVRFPNADITEIEEEMAPPSLWSSLAQLARMASGTTTTSPDIALEIGYPSVEDKKGYKLNLGLVKVALYAKQKTERKPRSRKSSETDVNRFVVRMRHPVDATRLRVYPDGQVTGNYEYALNAFGLKIGVGMERRVNVLRYRIDRNGVRHVLKV